MNLAVLGLQWGDEGKGKAIDYLAADFDVVIRYQGGHNAGHTIYYEGKKVILHLLPSGVFTPETISVIGNGVVINPIQFCKEIENLEALGLSLDNLLVSCHAPLILPFHQQLDIIFEKSRYLKIGTTKRGIGPAYEDLAGRRAVLVTDLFDKKKFFQKVKSLNEYYNKLIEAYGGERIQVESYIEEYFQIGQVLKKFVANTTYALNKYFQEGKSLLFEGAQGALLDINLGTYPFVTSSNSTIGGICIGTGLPFKAIEKITGISKSYATRVGGGPFPSELAQNQAKFLREKGNEFGSTTGRPRRVGWLDLVALKYAIMINGIDEIFMTKLDVLDEFKEIKVVTAYELDGQRTHVFDFTYDYLSRVMPVLESVPGWSKDISSTTDFAKLPVEARNYIKFIEDYLEIPVKFVSVGTNRDQTIEK